MNSPLKEKINQSQSIGDSFSTGTKEKVYQIRMDCDDEYIGLTVGLYKYFYSQGQLGRDAKALYQHLIFTSKLQYGNPNIQANNTYLKNGMMWGDTKLRRAKAFLRKAGLVTYVQEKENGRYCKTFISLSRNLNEVTSDNWKSDKRQIVNQEELPETKPEINEIEEQPENDYAQNNKDTKEPVGQFSTDRVERTTDDNQQTNKDRIKETYKKEEEERKRENPSSSLLLEKNNKIDDLIKGFESKISEYGKGNFKLNGETRSILIEAVNNNGIEWTSEQLYLYSSKKTIPQVRNFSYIDIPIFFKKAIQKKDKQSINHHQVTEIVICPSCEAEQPQGKTIVECLKCGLPRKSFNDPEAIKKNVKWYTEYKTNKVDLFKFRE